MTSDEKVTEAIVELRKTFVKVKTRISKKAEAANRMYEEGLESLQKKCSHSGTKFGESDEAICPSCGAELVTH